MATIKSYTDISQSKVLSKILPLESADMYYLAKPDDTNSNMVASDICIPRRSENDGQAFGEACAWSLTALLEVLPEYNLQRTDWGNKTEYKIVVTINEDNYASNNYDNPLDACYELILKLHELKML